MVYVLGGYINSPGGGGIAMVMSGSIASGAVISGSIASGTVTQFELSSGAVNSGHIASGAVQGFFGSTRNISSGTLGSFDFGSGAVGAGAIGSGAVVSGNIASGQVGGFALASGAVQSGHIGNAAVVSGSLASGQVFDFHFASGAMIDVAHWLEERTFISAEAISGGRAVGFNQSGAVQIAMASVSGRMPAVGVAAVNVASGVLTTINTRGRVFSTVFNFSGWMNQPIYVGASGDLVASGAPILSGNIQQIVGVSCQQSGLFVQVGDPLEAVLVQSGDVGSGAILGQAGSGTFNIASGTVTTYDCGSGLTAARSQLVTPFYSGTSWNIITEETISGCRAVNVSQSGYARVAMASVSGRMPAVGIVIDNVASGLQANIYSHGDVQLTSGLADYSGFLGRAVWVGRSGQIVSVSGSFNSGGLNLASGGDFVQRAGVIINSGRFLIDICHTMGQTQLVGATNVLDTVNRGFGV